MLIALITFSSFSVYLVSLSACSLLCVYSLLICLCSVRRVLCPLPSLSGVKVVAVSPRWDDESFVLESFNLYSLLLSCFSLLLTRAFLFFFFRCITRMCVLCVFILSPAPLVCVCVCVCVCVIYHRTRARKKKIV